MSSEEFRGTRNNFPVFEEQFLCRIIREDIKIFEERGFPAPDVDEEQKITKLELFEGKPKPAEIVPEFEKFWKEAEYGVKGLLFSTIQDRVLQKSIETLQPHEFWRDVLEAKFSTEPSFNSIQQKYKAWHAMRISDFKAVEEFLLHFIAKWSILNREMSRLTSREEGSYNRPISEEAMCLQLLAILPKHLIPPKRAPKKMFSLSWIVSRIRSLATPKRMKAERAAPPSLDYMLRGQRAILEDGSEGWLLDKILSRRSRRSKVEYLVKWVDCPAEEATWEPKSNLLNVLDLVNEFDKKHPRRARPKRRQFIKEELHVTNLVHTSNGKKLILKDGSERWVMDRILASRRRNGRLEYLVKWNGCPENEATWEPTSHLRNVPQLISDFVQRSRRRPTRSCRIPKRQKVKLERG